MKLTKFNSEKHEEPTLEALQYLFGQAHFERKGLFSSPHGKVRVVSAKKITKEERKQTMPYPGAYIMDGRKFYILYA